MAQLRAKGFTLIELVIVIVLLAIIGTFSFRFIGLGADVYRDTSAREQLISQSRFALERLSRELRNALPLSVRVYDNNRCIQYVPILTSGEYLEVPTTANPGDTVTAIAPLERRTPLSPSQHLVIFNTQTPAIYDNSGQRYVIDDRQIDSSTNTIEFELSSSSGANIEFNNTGPSRRFYEVSPPVSWCYLPENGQLRRFQSTSFSAAPPVNTTVSSGALMAAQLGNEQTTPPTPLFEVDNVVLSQNNLVLINIVVTRDAAGEELNLLYEVHIPNVP
ncbi:MSHA biogenesis protein MshO [Idiomarina aquatica]|uniref:MSHA biogenesis protein MshO n=1 Tax=Idiomarina aquatica TaxID=1327752 RepID=A0A4R6P4J1_9GAMM|nr:type II secretion system protein [Idiomarina aquatica]TDP32744.1 MSHA biogenesis protein MshO [Idiomarina aquatica]